MKDFSKETVDDSLESNDISTNRENILKWNNSAKTIEQKKIVLYAIAKLSSFSFSAINANVNTQGTLNFGDEESKEIYSIFSNLKEVVYGDSFLVYCWGEIQESSLSDYIETAKARIGNDSFSDFKSFYEAIQDGYEYADEGCLSNEILFYTFWNKTYNILNK
jgi:hypothetical protein